MGINKTVPVKGAKGSRQGRSPRPLRLFGLLLAACLVFGSAAIAQKPLAFPGAEGFGKYTTGGRGGRVLIVSNLNDAGPGSLREAIGAKGPRTIVFAVSGTIALQSKLAIRNGDLTIAGQSAPGDGICLRNYNVQIDADNVILRYLRFRLGDETRQQDDALTGMRRKNIIIDHCSMSWATDECATFYDNEAFTMQWCIISESLNSSVHAKGEHGYGGIWGGMGASFHHNLLAHQHSRNPRFCGARYHKQPEREVVDFRNNVIFNWGINSSYGGERGNHNIVGNYYKAGPATLTKRRNRIVNPSSPIGKFYVADNLVDGNEAISRDNWAGGVEPDRVSAQTLDSARAAKAFSVEAIAAETAKEAYARVLQQAGASHRRDAVDQRIVADVQSGKATNGKNGIIDSQTAVGGWPELRQEKAPADVDLDGMPDAWEKANGLNPASPADAVAYTLDRQFTNLEMYLNGLLAGQSAVTKK